MRRIRAHERRKDVVTDAGSHHRSIQLRAKGCRPGLDNIFTSTCARTLLSASVGDKPKLEELIRSTTAPADLAGRARVVLLASEGVPNYEIAALVGMSRPTVNRWRSRYAACGMAGLENRKRPRRTRIVDQAKIITETLKPPPKSLGVTHWSRLLARRVGVDHSTVAHVWREYGVKPWKAETFKFSTILNWSPRSPTSSGSTWPRRTTRSSLCCDAESQIQGLDRTRRCCRCSPDPPGNAPTTTSGTARHHLVRGAGDHRRQSHRRVQEPPSEPGVSRVSQAPRPGLPRPGAAPGDGQLRPHKRPEVKAWLADSLRIHVHFTPHVGLLAQLVEVWFGIIERQAIHRGTFRSVGT